MHAYQIVAGFSEIKIELRKKARISKPIKDLHLWFSIEENILSVHDYEEHGKFITLAVYDDRDDWTIIYKDILGRRVIDYGIRKAEKFKEAKELNELYESHGFFTYY